jgi:hypothetical protein
MFDTRRIVIAQDHIFLGELMLSPSARTGVQWDGKQPGYDPMSFWSMSPCRNSMAGCWPTREKILLRREAAHENDLEIVAEAFRLGPSVIG